MNTKVGLHTYPPPQTSRTLPNDVWNWNFGENLIWIQLKDLWRRKNWVRELKHTKELIEDIEDLDKKDDEMEETKKDLEAKENELQSLKVL